MAGEAEGIGSRVGWRADHDAIGHQLALEWDLVRIAVERAVAQITILQGDAVRIDLAFAVDGFALAGPSLATVA